MAPSVPFNKMREDAHAWTNDIAARLGHENPQAAFHALRGVFFALRDRLPVEQAFHLASQLPTLLRGVYFEGYNPSHKPDKYGREEFMQHVSGELQCVGGGNPDAATAAVCAVLAAHVSPGEIEQLRNVLPKEMQDLLDT